MIRLTSSLPAQPTPLIGRSHAIMALCELVLADAVRLVTITGAAGIGKTRLALAAANDVEPSFTEGATFVDLSTVTEPGQVLVAIGRGLGLLDLTQATAFERVRRVVRTGSHLLVLDNFEQVLPAATEVARLLAETDQLKVLVTSRTTLRIRWEHVFEVSPLELPDAVTLFLERAIAAGADPAEYKDDPAVADLCLRLDGLPLAVELAATQARSMSPRAQLTRLDRRLDLLASGARDQPARQRTLREAIGWSYRLLSEDLRRLFRRLSVFVGSISLDAARGIAEPGADESRVLANLMELADFNLLRHERADGGEISFGMLETIRDYAREQLADSGEMHEVQLAYAMYWRDLAERAAGELHGSRQIEWLDCLERERSNINAVLTWCYQTDQLELGLRLAAAMSWFWYLRGGDRSEGRAWLERFAHRAAGLSSVSAREARARALIGAGVIAQYQLGRPAALSLLESALELGREMDHPGLVAEALGRLAHLNLFRAELEHADELATASYDGCRALSDTWGMAFALSMRGFIARSRDHSEDAEQFLRESLALFNECGDRWGVAHVMLGLGQLAHAHGNDVAAADCWQERLRLSREIDNQTAVAHTLDLLATLARDNNDYARSAELFREALSIKRRIGDRQALAWALQGVGELALVRNELREAATSFEEALRLRRETDDRAGLVVSLLAFARLSARLGRARRAIRLAGVAIALHHDIGPSLAVQHYSQQMLPATVPALSEEIQRAERRLGPKQRDAAWKEGAALPLEQAIQEALDLAAELARAGTTATRSSTTLTPREKEIAGLLARGCSNREIAAALVITEGSAHVQVVRLLSKLGVHSRAQAAVWAAGQAELDLSKRASGTPS